MSISKIKEIFKKIKGVFAKKQSRIEKLEGLVTILEKRIFKEKEEDGSYRGILNNYYFSFNQSLWGEKVEPISLEEEIMELQDKLDVLAKKLKLSIEKSPAKESEWVVKKLVPAKK